MEVEDGIKKVTVKTIKNGKEEVFEDEDVKKYIINENSGKVKIKVK